jgi:hypothetical protein
MMYANRFVCAVRVNGKILREQSNIVTLPFGCEYEILLKNLNSRRAMVNVCVDGADASDGKLIIGPNSTVTLERFIRNGNLQSGNRFRFIERTAGIEAHRGIKTDDGLIRAEFWAEKEVIDRPIIRHHYHDIDHWPYYPYPPRRRRWNDPSPDWTLTKCVGGTQTQTSTTQGIGESVCFNSSSGGFEDSETCRGGGPMYNRSQGSAEAPGAQINMMAMNMSDAGITVPGSESHQQFYRTSGFPLESNSSVIVLQLRGEVGGVQVAAPVTVEQKPVCSSCGKTNRATNRFCDQCGTGLVLI